MELSWTELIREAGDVWQKGGWAIYPLALNALILYTLAAWIHINLMAKGHNVKTEKRVKRLSKRLEADNAGPNADLPPDEYGAAREYLRERDLHVRQVDSIEQMQGLFEELRAREIPPIDRDLKVMRIAMSTAPLLGLLGTVTGMFTTFAGLSESTGGDSTVGSVASGISEALITTQTGLTIALPGYFLNYFLTRERDKLRVFLNHLEIVCTQHMRRSASKAERRRRSEAGDRKETAQTEAEATATA
jgi:biopolymer transport protein ExbB